MTTIHCVSTRLSVVANAVSKKSWFGGDGEYRHQIQILGYGSVCFIEK